MMSVHVALEAWQAGEITSARAVELTSAEDVMELHAFAPRCGVDIRQGFLPREEHVAAATLLIARLIRTEAESSGRIAPLAVM